MFGKGLIVRETTILLHNISCSGVRANVPPSPTIWELHQHFSPAFYFLVKERDHAREEGAKQVPRELLETGGYLFWTSPQCVYGRRITSRVKFPQDGLGALVLSTLADFKLTLADFNLAKSLPHLNLLPMGKMMEGWMDGWIDTICDYLKSCLSMDVSVQWPS